MAWSRSAVSQRTAPVATNVRASESVQGLAGRHAAAHSSVRVHGSVCWMVRRRGRAGLWAVMQRARGSLAVCVGLPRRGEIGRLAPISRSADCRLCHNSVLKCAVQGEHPRLHHRQEAQKSPAHFHPQTSWTLVLRTLAVHVSMENSGEAEDAKPKKRARSALRLGPKERAARAQAAKEEETAAAAAAAKPTGSKRAKAPKAEKPAHEVFVANLPFDVTEERVSAPACAEGVRVSAPACAECPSSALARQHVQSALAAAHPCGWAPPLPRLGTAGAWPPVRPPAAPEAGRLAQACPLAPRGAAAPLGPSETACARVPGPRSPGSHLRLSPPPTQG